MLGDVFNILLRIAGDPDEAQRALAEVAADLKAFSGLEGAARVGVDGAEAAKAKLAELQAKIDALHGKDVKVDVDTSRVSQRLGVLRGALDDALSTGNRTALSHVVRDVENVGRDVEAVTGRVTAGIGARIAGFFAGLPQRIGGFLSNLPSEALSGVSKISSDLLSKVPLVGGAFEGLGSAGAAAAPLVIALGVALAGLVGSAVAAIAGLAALATSFAAVFIPPLALAIAVVAKLTSIIKDYKAQQDGAAQSHRQVAQAAQTQAAAQQSLSDAYANLRQQTLAATQAAQDNRQAVIEDALAVKQASLDVDQAHLNVRKAEQALRDFRAQVGASQGSFADLFKKATDVDFKLSPRTLDSLVKGAAPKATPDQSIQLEQLILDIRDAKLREQQATNGLHDSNVKLQRDRQTESQFLTEGLKAYPAYASAVKQVRTAQDQLATATRGVASAQETATKKLEDLSPAEQRIGRTLSAIGEAVDRVLTPVLDRALGGLVRGIQAFATILNDGSIRRALTSLGDAMGHAFAGFGQFLSGGAMRQAFAAIIDGSTRLVQILGDRAIPAFFETLTNIAVAGLPVLLRLLSRFADFLQGLGKSSRDRKDLRDDIDGLVKSTVLWTQFLTGLVELLYRVSVALAPIGNAILSVFVNPQQAIRDLLASLGLSGREITGIGKGVTAIADVINKVFGPSIRTFQAQIRTSIGAALALFGGMANFIDDLAHVRWAKAWSDIGQIPVTIFHDLLKFLATMTAPIRSLGSSLGDAFSTAFKGAISGIAAFVRNVFNDMIAAIDFVIRKVDSIIGTINKFSPFPDIPKIPQIPKIGGGGSPSLSDRIAQVVKGAPALGRTPPQTGNVPGSGAGRRGDTFVTVPVTVAGGGAPNVDQLTSLLSRKMRRLGMA